MYTHASCGDACVDVTMPVAAHTPHSFLCIQPKSRCLIRQLTKTMSSYDCMCHELTTSLTEHTNNITLTLSLFIQPKNRTPPDLAADEELNITLITLTLILTTTMTGGPGGDEPGQRRRTPSLRTRHVRHWSGQMGQRVVRLHTERESLGGSVLPRQRGPHASPPAKHG